MKIMKTIPKYNEIDIPTYHGIWYTIYMWYMYMEFYYKISQYT